MVWLINRMSSLLLLAFACWAVTVIIPANTDEGFGVFVQPSSMPIAATVVVGLGAFITLFEAAGRDDPDLATVGQVTLYLAILAASIWLMGLIGFKLAAPILSLSIMWLAHERRWVWLAVGAIATPLAIWLMFEVLLERSLP